MGFKRHFAASTALMMTLGMGCQTTSAETPDPEFSHANTSASEAVEPAEVVESSAEDAPDADVDEPHDRMPTCISEEESALARASDCVWDAYEEASLIPLRAGLERVARGQAELETARWNRENHEDGGAWGEFVSAHVRATLTAGETQTHYHVACDDFLTMARRTLSPQTWSWEGFEVLVDPYRMRAGEHVLMDAREQWCGPGSVTWDPIRLLSWVGPVLTVSQSSVAEDYRMHVHSSWTSHDLRSGDEAALDALVETASFIEAFKNDPWVEERIASMLQAAERRQERGEGAENAVEEVRQWRARFQAAESLEELVEMFNEGVGKHAYGTVQLSHAHASFAGFDEERGLVAMRLALPHWPSSGQRDYITLGLWVRPRAEFQEAFQRAKEGGWLLDEERVVEGFELIEGGY